ncbi:type IV pilus secretin PilQ [Trinickia acidisoli]|uniref:type IV pilus secretin PilQ n=1 Tax=Trinickia acidisoli TaxID=2767482 RepID=UPI001A9028D7|nr:type IV pilus secretin PilQ [Trinickia acidisoli]
MSTPNLGSNAVAVALRAVIAFASAGATAQVAPLPPLPPAILADGAVEQAASPWPSVGEPPLDAEPSQDGGEELDVAPGFDASKPARAGAGAPYAAGERRSLAQAALDATPALEGPPVPLAPAPRMSEGAADGAAAGSEGDKPITMRFKNADLADVLDAFSRFTGLNIVASERARGRVSLSLVDVPWRTAFDTLLDAQGLAMSRRGNVVWVAPQAELAARERQRFETHARAADLEPLVSRTFALSYPRADEIQRLLTASGAQRVLSKRGAAMADARTNLLFVTDLKARLDQVAQLIDAIDKPNRQVLIEARIVEGERGFSRELGARLSMRSTGGAASGGPSGVDFQERGFAGGAQGAIHDMSARAIAGFEAATAGLTLFAAGATRLVTAELSALEAQGRGQIVSSPRVVTADRTKALVEQGTELPYQAKVRNGVSGVQFRRVSLKLEVEPRITPHGRVILDLDIAKDSVGKLTAGGPAIDTKHVRTRVEVEDGGTVSIGGIYESQDRDDVTRLPLLGKIPLLGALFRHRAVREQRSELVVFITPRVVAID